MVVVGVVVVAGVAAAAVISSSRRRRRRSGVAAAAVAEVAVAVCEVRTILVPPSRPQRAHIAKTIKLQLH